MSDKTHLFIDRMPEHCIALGRLVAHWSMFERKLIHILQLLLSTDIYKAILIFDEFNSIRSKINLLLKLNYRFTYDKTLRDDIDTHLTKAYNLIKIRNSYIHALYNGDNRGVMRRKMTPIDYKKPDTPFEVVTVKEIQDDVDKIAKLSRSFDFLIARIAESQKAQP